MIDPGNSQEEKEMNEAAASEQQESLQEQQSQTQEVNNKTEQDATTEKQDAPAADVVADETSAPRGKKRVKKKVRQVTEAELMPHPSIWPLLLAFSVAVMLGGFAFNLIILGVGVIMVIASIIGWSLERR
ncbi:MAG: cytochrome c oxidase subunit 4 [Ktedonobacteraceae bacterium]|nr:cytochrome c oxidase subunit 4 [Ktedonobacteraceae bacterium]MBV9710320.1 cytochrome c oxidase subunit 4 [Ktedonobacteraceae bacterium]